jgi:metal-responsive CopG/Arc/MetJ family transcriptional regulator
MKKKITISINEELLQELEKYAEENFMKKTQVIEKALIMLFKSERNSI